MIFEFILDQIFGAFFVLVDLIPDFDLNYIIPEEAVTGSLDVFVPYLKTVGYVFPVAALSPILLFSFGWYSFKFIWALVLRIKSFVPAWGN
jgi:hypothetical protein